MTHQETFSEPKKVPQQSSTSARSHKSSFADLPLSQRSPSSTATGTELSGGVVPKPSIGMSSPSVASPALPVLSEVKPPVFPSSFGSTPPVRLASSSPPTTARPPQSPPSLVTSACRGPLGEKEGGGTSLMPPTAALHSSSVLSPRATSSRSLPRHTTAAPLPLLSGGAGGASAEEADPLRRKIAGSVKREVKEKGNPLNLPHMVGGSTSLSTMTSSRPHTPAAMSPTTVGSRVPPLLSLLSHPSSPVSSAVSHDVSEEVGGNEGSTAIEGSCRVECPSLHRLSLASPHGPASDGLLHVSSGSALTAEEGVPTSEMVLRAESTTPFREEKETEREYIDLREPSSSRTSYSSGHIPRAPHPSRTSSTCPSVSPLTSPRDLSRRPFFSPSRDRPPRHERSSRSFDPKNTSVNEEGKRAIQTNSQPNTTPLLPAGVAVGSTASLGRTHPPLLSPQHDIGKRTPMTVPPSPANHDGYSSPFSHPSFSSSLKTKKGGEDDRADSPTSSSSSGFSSSSFAFATDEDPEQTMKPPSHSGAALDQWKRTAGDHEEARENAFVGAVPKQRTERWWEKEEEENGEVEKGLPVPSSSSPKSPDGSSNTRRRDYHHHNNTNHCRGAVGAPASIRIREEETPGMGEENHGSTLLTPSRIQDMSPRETTPPSPSPNSLFYHPQLQKNHPNNKSSRKRIVTLRDVLVRSSFGDHRATEVRHRPRRRSSNNSSKTIPEGEREKTASTRSPATSKGTSRPLMELSLPSSPTPRPFPPPFSPATSSFLPFTVGMGVHPDGEGGRRVRIDTQKPVGVLDSDTSMTMSLPSSVFALEDSTSTISPLRAECEWEHTDQIYRKKKVAAASGWGEDDEEEDEEECERTRRSSDDPIRKSGSIMEGVDDAHRNMWIPLETESRDREEVENADWKRRKRLMSLLMKKRQKMKNGLHLASSIHLTPPFPSTTESASGSRTSLGIPSEGVEDSTELFSPPSTSALRSDLLPQLSSPSTATLPDGKGRPRGTEGSASPLAVPTRRMSYVGPSTAAVSGTDAMRWPRSAKEGDSYLPTEREGHGDVETSSVGHSGNGEGRKKERTRAASAVLYSSIPLQTPPVAEVEQTHRPAHDEGEHMEKKTTYYRHHEELHKMERPSKEEGPRHDTGVEKKSSKSAKMAADHMDPFAVSPMAPLQTETTAPIPSSRPHRRGGEGGGVHLQSISPPSVSTTPSTVGKRGKSKRRPTIMHTLPSLARHDVWEAHLWETSSAEEEDEEQEEEEKRLREEKEAGVGWNTAEGTSPPSQGEEKTVSQAEEEDGKRKRSAVLCMIALALAARRAECGEREEGEKLPPPLSFCDAWWSRSRKREAEGTHVEHHTEGSQQTLNRGTHHQKEAARDQSEAVATSKELHSTGRSRGGVSDTRRDTMFVTLHIVSVEFSTPLGSFSFSSSTFSSSFKDACTARSTSSSDPLSPAPPPPPPPLSSSTRGATPFRGHSRLAHGEKYRHPHAPSFVVVPSLTADDGKEEKEERTLVPEDEVEEEEEIFNMMQVGTTNKYPPRRTVESSHGKGEASPPVDPASGTQMEKRKRSVAGAKDKQGQTHPRSGLPPQVSSSSSSFPGTPPVAAFSSSPTPPPHDPLSTNAFLSSFRKGVAPSCSSSPLSSFASSHPQAARRRCSSPLAPALGTAPSPRMSATTSALSVPPRMVHNYLPFLPEDAASFFLSFSSPFSFHASTVTSTSSSAFVMPPCLPLPDEKTVATLPTFGLRGRTRLAGLFWRVRLLAWRLAVSNRICAVTPTPPPLLSHSFSTTSCSTSLVRILELLHSLFVFAVLPPVILQEPKAMIQKAKERDDSTKTPTSETSSSSALASLLPPPPLPLVTKGMLQTAREALSSSRGQSNRQGTSGDEEDRKRTSTATSSPPLVLLPPSYYFPPLSGRLYYCDGPSLSALASLPKEKERVDYQDLEHSSLVDSTNPPPRVDGGETETIKDKEDARKPQEWAWLRPLCTEADWALCQQYYLGSSFSGNEECSCGEDEGEEAVQERSRPKREPLQLFFFC